MRPKRSLIIMLTMKTKAGSRLFNGTRGGGGIIPYKGLMGLCGQPGYVFRDCCLKRGIDFNTFCLNQDIDFINFFPKRNGYLFLDNKQPMFYDLNYSIFRVKCLKQNIKNRNSVLNREGKSAIFVLDRVRV